MASNRSAISRSNYFKAFLLCTIERLVWIVCAFVVYAVSGYSFLAAAALALLFIIFLLVGRFILSYQLTCLVRPATKRTVIISSLPCLIRGACVRLVAALVWMLPFLMVFFRLYSYIFVLPATTWTKDFTSIGAFIFPQDADYIQLYKGTIIFFAMLGTTFLLSIYGWRRGAAFEFQQVNDLPLADTLRHARYSQRIARGRMFLLYWQHVLFCLPALVVPLLIPYLKLSHMMTGKIMTDLQSIFVFLKAGIVSNATFMLSLVAFFVLYFPVLPIRKLRIADALVNGHDRRKGQ